MINQLELMAKTVQISYRFPKKPRPRRGRCQPKAYSSPKKRQCSLWAFSQLRNRNARCARLDKVGHPIAISLFFMAKFRCPSSKCIGQLGHLVCLAPTRRVEKRVSCRKSCFAGRNFQVEPLSSETRAEPIRKDPSDDAGIDSSLRSQTPVHAARTDSKDPSRPKKYKANPVTCAVSCLARQIRIHASGIFRRLLRSTFLFLHFFDRGYHPKNSTQRQTTLRFQSFGRRPSIAAMGRNQT